MKRGILVFVLLHLSCTHDPILVDPDSMGTYYLISQISPNISPNGAVVGYSLPETMPEDVSGAEVTLAGNGQNVVLSELQPGVYADDQKMVDVVPGERYDISARINEDVLLYAHTYLPGDFFVLKENMPDTLVYLLKGLYYKRFDSFLFFVKEVEPPLIKWSNSEHAFVYQLTWHADKKSETLDSFQTSSYLPANYYPRYKHFDDPEYCEWDSTCVFSITAFDSTYLPFKTNPSTDFNNQNGGIEKYMTEWGYNEGHNDNIKGGGFGHFSSTHTITDSVVVRFKKIILDDMELVLE